MMQKLELPMYTVSESEKLAGLPKNMGYKLIRQGVLFATRDVNGQLRIPYEELVRFVLSRS
jgi:hypothetical protein